MRTSRVARASGFTLLEVMVAIVLTGLVVLLAYGAAQVSYDAHARLRADVDALQEAQALRELLQDALRSARAPQRLQLSATPVGRAPAAQVTIRAPGVTRWDVRARLAGASGWLEEWPMTTVLPSAVAITMWHDSTPVGLPLQVRVVAGSALVQEGSIR